MARSFEGLNLDLFIGPCANDLAPELYRPVPQPASRDDPREHGCECLPPVCAVCSDGITVQLLFVPEAYEALVVDEARERAHGEGSTTEPEAPNAIIVVVVAAQKFVELDRVLLDANAECKTQNLHWLGFRGADAIAERSDLISVGKIERFIEPPNVCFVGRRCAVTGAVREHDQITHEILHRETVSTAISIGGLFFIFQFLRQFTRCSESTTHCTPRPIVSNSQKMTKGHAISDCGLRLSKPKSDLWQSG